MAAGLNFRLFNSTPHPILSQTCYFLLRPTHPVPFGNPPPLYVKTTFSDTTLCTPFELLPPPYTVVGPSILRLWLPKDSCLLPSSRQIPYTGKSRSFNHQSNRLSRDPEIPYRVSGDVVSWDRPQFSTEGRGKSSSEGGKTEEDIRKEVVMQRGTPILNKGIKKFLVYLFFIYFV